MVVDIRKPGGMEQPVDRYPGEEGFVRGGVGRAIHSNSGYLPGKKIHTVPSDGKDCREEQRKA